MPARYIALDDLQGQQDPASISHSNLVRNKSWRLPKRWITFSLVLAAILTLYLISGILPSSIITTRLGHGSTPVDSLYFLGDEEDQTRLWFPPPGSGQFEPRVATFNEPPPPSVRPRTPLLIAFTRNHKMLEQTVLSYIAAGWPREDIIVVDNSGTMDANNLGLLSKNNPFFLDYTKLRFRYGVSILQTPTLLNFPQVMNFYLRLSMAHGWRYFFWSHMDVAVLSDETAEPYLSFYQRILAILQDLGIHSLTSDAVMEAGQTEKWAVKYFSYDWLTLVNVAAWRQIGQWDNFISYYSSDCDAYSRIALHGFTKGDVRAGRIFDLSSVMDDLEAKFFPDPSSGSSSDKSSLPTDLNSRRYQDLLDELQRMEIQKPEDNRNNWQGADTVGGGEPWTYDPVGFQEMWWKTADLGRQLYLKKWGTSECRLDEHGVKLSDEWKNAH